MKSLRNKKTTGHLSRWLVTMRLRVKVLTHIFVALGPLMAVPCKGFRTDVTRTDRPLAAVGGLSAMNLCEAGGGLKSGGL